MRISEVSPSWRISIALHIFVNTIRYHMLFKHRLKLWQLQSKNLQSQCCGYGMFIQVTDFSIPDPVSRGRKDPVSGSASKNLSIFNPKIFFYALGNMIRDVHPGSGFFPIPNLGSWGQKRTGIPDPGSATLSRDSGIESVL